MKEKEEIRKIKKHKHSKLRHYIHVVQRFFKRVNPLLPVLILFVLVGISIFADKNAKGKGTSGEIIMPVTEQEDKNIKNYDGIITIVDGEGENSFTGKWGSLIEDGYPVCSNLVTTYIGKDGYMDWNVIENLNNVGVEFVFHQCGDDPNIKKDSEGLNDYMLNGIEMIDNHNLNHDFLIYGSNIDDDIYKLCKENFKGAFKLSSSVNTNGSLNIDLYKMNILYEATNYSYSQLTGLINNAIKNNGWVVLFTRNPEIDKNQIETFRKAFEYAEENNCKVVGLSEGFDLYYGNKLGN